MREENVEEKQALERAALQFLNWWVWVTRKWRHSGHSLIPFAGERAICQDPQNGSCLLCPWRRVLLDIRVSDGRWQTEDGRQDEIAGVWSNLNSLGSQSTGRNGFKANTGAAIPRARMLCTYHALKALFRGGQLYPKTTQTGLSLNQVSDSMPKGSTVKQEGISGVRTFSKLSKQWPSNHCLAT